MENKASVRKRNSAGGTRFGLGLMLSVLIALLATAVLILCEALVLKAAPLANGVLTAMNYVIRMLAILAGSIVFAKEAGGCRGWQRALGLGFLYWLCMALLHRATAQAEPPLGVLLTDAALCVVMALVCGAFTGGKKDARISGRRRT